MQNAINMNASQNNIVTLQDIANELNLCRSTVVHALSDLPYYQKLVSSKTRERVRNCAKAMKYDPMLAMRKSKKDGCVYAKKDSCVCGWFARSTSGNFATRQEETERMLFLRNKHAMTNPEIAKKMGVSYPVVLKRIGPQPKELTVMSYALRGERVTRRNHARRNLLLDQKISLLKVLQQEVDAQTKQTEQMEAEANRAMIEAQRLMDQAKQKRDQLSGKVIELESYRKEAQKAAKSLGRSLA